MGARVKTSERIVMDEAGTYVAQSVRRVPEEQRYDHRLLQSVRGTPWEPNQGDVSTDLPEPMLIIPPLPDVEPAPTQTCNVYIRKMDLERFGHTAGCPVCEVYRAGSPTSGQEHTADCRKRLEDVMTTDASTSTQVRTTRVRQAERIIRNSNDAGVANPSSPSGSGQHKRVRLADQEGPDPKPEHNTEMRTGSQEAPETRKRQSSGTEKTTPTTKLTCSFLQQRDCYVASVHETGGDKPVCEEPKTPFLYDERMGLHR